MYLRICTNTYLTCKKDQLNTEMYERFQRSDGMENFIPNCSLKKLE